MPGCGTRPAHWCCTEVTHPCTRKTTEVWFCCLFTTLVAEKLRPRKAVVFLQLMLLMYHVCCFYATPPVVKKIQTFFGVSTALPAIARMMMMVIAYHRINLKSRVDMKSWVWYTYSSGIFLKKFSRRISPCSWPSLRYFVALLFGVGSGLLLH